MLSEFEETKLGILVSRIESSESIKQVTPTLYKDFLWLAQKLEECNNQLKSIKDFNPNFPTQPKHSWDAIKGISDY